MNLPEGILKQTRLWPDGPFFQQTEYLGITTDSLLLADFAVVRAGERGADLGCGSGILMLLLLWREAKLHMTGLEIQEEACALAEENIRVNALETRAAVVPGDLRETVKRLPNGGFDVVISNPPYFGQEQGKRSPEAGRAAARAETALSMKELCHTAARLCRSGGRLYLCHRPERLSDLLREMNSAHLEPKRLRFVHHDAGREASLVLVEGRKDGHPGIAVEKPLLTHDLSGAESEEYRKICHV